MSVIVTTACVQDRDGLKKLLRSFGVHRKKLRKIWVDGGYRGQVLEWVKSRFRYCLEVVLRSDDVKRIGRFTKTSETMIQLAMIRLMLRRLKPL